MTGNVSGHLDGAALHLHIVAMSIPTNQEVAHHLERLAIRRDAAGLKSNADAYEKAATNVRQVKLMVAAMSRDELMKIPGVGARIAATILEHVRDCALATNVGPSSTVLWVAAVATFMLGAALTASFWL